MSDLNIILVLLTVLYHIVYAADSCESRYTCKDCIKDPSVCVWCAKNDFTGPRCKIQNATTNKDWCSDLLQNPFNSKHNFSLDSNHVIQIQPQKYSMKLRPGTSEEFEFYFQAAKDFPVDLYFLLDSSSTMSRIKNTTAEQAENIYQTIKTMTNDVYLGFGSFVDKPILPFSTYFNTTTNYSFRHRLSLTDNLTRFKDIVSKTPTGINRDIQEGGLDALAQVIVCKKLIGWRNESRKIIVYLSDGPYHAAGDGKVAGLFKPYDGQCYTEKELYTKELEMDYPSVGLINKLAMERNMVILFYVLHKVQYIYLGLSTEIRGSRLSIFTEQSDSETDESLVKTLKKIYEELSKKLTLNVRVTSGSRKNFEILFNPDCTSETSGPDCNVEIGKKKLIVGTVKLLEFVDHKMQIDIGIESIGEKLTLEIEVIKSCDCEASSKLEFNSTFCYGELRSCGICDCGTKRYGERCACTKNTKNNFNDKSTCILKGSDIECSGHGTCVCGSCRCSDGGKFCDCSNEGCPRDGNGNLCSGETHGDCVCGECKCKPDWTGKACECLNTDCKINGKVCHGRGDCVCGNCECHNIPEWDMRTEDKQCRMFSRSDTHYRQCITLESCANCERKGHDDCITCSDEIQTKVIQAVPQEYINSTTWKVCEHLKVDIGCYSKFAYRYNDENSTIELVVELDKNCAETFYIFGGILLLTLVLVGVGIIVGWKLMVDARDHLEYKQFSKNIQDVGSFRNPLYIEPSSSFHNPTFRKRSYR